MNDNVIELEIPAYVQKIFFETEVKNYLPNIRLEYTGSDNNHHKYLVYFIYPQDLVLLGEIKYSHYKT